MITYPTRSERLSDRARPSEVGRISHAEIDAQIPTREEKEALSRISPPIANFSANGLKVLISTADVTAPPTDADLDAAFGTPATVGAGFIALVDDAGAGAAVYLLASDGTNWWQVALTKCV